jgi:hypothetical protein
MDSKQSIFVKYLLQQVRTAVAELHAGDLQFYETAAAKENNLRYTPSFVRGLWKTESESRPYTARSLAWSLGETSASAQANIGVALELLELIERGICTEETILAMAEGRLSLSALRLLVHSLRRADQERKFGKRRKR